MRKVLIDAHTHTVASGHAYSSLQEMAKAAADMELEVLGITEHGPSVPGTCPTLYFKNMFTVPRQMYGIRLLMGCEINILDTKGSLDLTDEQIGWLDLAIAGIHAAWYQGGTKEENTEGMIRVIKNPKIHIISHGLRAAGAGCQGGAYAIGGKQPFTGSTAQEDSGAG